MGGKALSVESCRIDPISYYLLYDIVSNKLSDVGVEHFKLVPGYSSKASHGDMDILVVGMSLEQKMTLMSSLQATEYNRNGDVFSFGITASSGVFQVDLITVQCIDVASYYFGYNDLGNLIGRVAHKMGFKYGHDGLKYVVREDGHSEHVLKEIVVSNDNKEIMEFLGYPYLTEGERKTRFKTLEDIFEYVSRGMYFNSDIYLLHNRNHIARTRDKKRPTYTAFLKWCEDNSESLGYQFPYTSRDWKTIFLEHAKKLWPEFAKELKEQQGLATMKREASLHFNGDKVKEWTGLEGKELGAFMKAFRGAFALSPGNNNYEHFYHWVVAVSRSSDDVSIEGIVKKFYGNYRIKNPAS